MVEHTKKYWTCLDLIRVKHDVKLLPRFDLSLMRTDQNDTKLVKLVLTTSAIPVKGNVIYARIFHNPYDTD